MSLKKTKALLKHYARAMPPGYPAPGGDKARAALAEIAALEKAATDLTRLHLGDGADDVAHREHVIQAMTDDPASQWNHPDVKAWSDAAVLLATISKEAK